MFSLCFILGGELLLMVIFIVIVILMIIIIKIVTYKLLNYKKTKGISCLYFIRVLAQALLVLILHKILL